MTWSGELDNVKTMRLGQLSQKKRIVPLLKPALITLAGIGVLLLYWGYIPISSLDWEATEVTWGEVKEICDSWPANYPSGMGSPSSLDSPNGKYYLEFGEARFRKAIELRLYQVGNNRLIGTYSYRDLYVYCWAIDSSGIYVSDYEPGSGGGIFTIWGDSGKIGPVKKIFVP